MAVVEEGLKMFEKKVERKAWRKVYKGELNGARSYVGKTDEHSRNCPYMAELTEGEVCKILEYYGVCI
ncbi:hypothetical protein B0I26_11521 [Anoxybacillus vitaminiphilus]|uniref:Uncharacterized protein n=1 Tax=Paranoxybacillus vitaminiphilus TaxID=581036 RepID=A0A327YAR4_9BACL|nr:hypothetical protein [Anoxybacillus vitaminiphilus]RAK16885.1 hypothetical protein B0I26_11521 [Anoxybacillus vitaminiphilus]